MAKNYWNIYFNKKCDKILLWFNENTFLINNI